MADIKGTLLRAFYAETGSLTDRKKSAKSYDFADFLSCVVKKDALCTSFAVSF